MAIWAWFKRSIAPLIFREESAELERLRARVRSLEALAGGAGPARTAATEPDPVDTGQFFLLLKALGRPVALMALQADMGSSPAAALQAEDYRAVAASLLEALSVEGIRVLGKAGEQTPFDPAWQRPKRRSVAIEPGQLVVVRTPGVGWQDRILEAAWVEPIGRDGA